MLLMKLKNKEKFAFLELAYYMAYIDGEFEISEKEVIEEYCVEMGIDNYIYNQDDLKLENILKQFISEESQKIILLELSILIHSDDKYHKFEQSLLEKIAHTFNVDIIQLQIYSQWGKMVSSLYAQGKLFLSNKSSKDN